MSVINEIGHNEIVVSESKLGLHDQIKNQYALDNHIPLVRLPYKLRDCLSIKDLMEDTYLVN